MMARTLGGIVWGLLLSQTCVGLNDPVPVEMFGHYEYDGSGLKLVGSLGDIGFGEPVMHVHVELTDLNNDICRLRFTDPANPERWQVPGIIQDLPSGTGKNKLIVDWTNSEAGATFQVKRADKSSIIFNGSGLVFNDRYLRLQTSVSENPFIVGLGERITSLKLPLGRTWAFMASDQGTPEERPLYGSHPFYLNIQDDMQAHGVFVLNSNPMEVDLFAGNLTYRFTGGIIDIFFFAGPTPIDVLHQYHSVIGFPMLHPAWYFGFHQSRWGYADLNQLTDVVNKYVVNNIPLDTMWNDIDYMNGYRIFSVDEAAYPLKDFQTFIDSLHNTGRHYMLIVDPGVKIDPEYETYSSGIEQDVFIRNIPSVFSDDKYLVGKLWPGLAHFPDWTHPNTSQWWTDHVSSFHEQLPIDGIWTDMNEVTNFCDGRCIIKADTRAVDNPATCDCENMIPDNFYDSPWPMTSRQPLESSRVCLSPKSSQLGCSSISMSAKYYNGARELEMHNLFGHMEAIATNKALKSVLGTRPVVLTRSTFPSSGKYASHWLGDNVSSFESMRGSVPGLLAMGIFGIPMIGADICGFQGETTLELCIRWFQLGSWYPFARNHNTLLSTVSQEAYTLGPVGVPIVRNALFRRYSLHYYMYTAAANAAINGTPIARPVFLEFPEDLAGRDLDEQFLLGSSLMICAQLYEGADRVKCHLPSAVTWFDYETAERVTTGEFKTPLSLCPVFVRGGSVIPRTKYPQLTVIDTRKQPLDLLIVLDQYSRAAGSLYLDDGIAADSIENKKFTNVFFTAFSDGVGDLIHIMADITDNGYASDLMIESLTVFPICSGQIYINGVYNRNGMIKLNAGKPFNLKYECKADDRMLDRSITEIDVI